ncbi:MAG: LysM peptidoglycan-binding domain-containing protein [Puniceicoccaceae bacterium]|nr:MAG: LysM peptidoglycan-binding domain-containing protein [Puniceicoccaceae bacterium]
MKVSKVFSCVLGLHLGVISILLVQPGCQTKQPPTQTYTQERASGSMATGGERTSASMVRTDSRTSPGLIEARRADAGQASDLDAAFNAGFDGADFAPESDFAPVAPITPLSRSGESGQTVPVAGASFETYTVKGGDNLWTIARRYNVSLNELYAANGLNKDSILRVGQQIQIPVEGGTAAVRTVTADTYQPTSLDEAGVSYTVKRGDTLSKIASQHGTTVNAIKAANNKSSDVIRVDERLIIPVSGARSGSSAPRASSTSSSATPSTPATSATSASATTGGRTHTVKAGEFPAAIARQYGMTTGELLALNGITDPRRLQVGQVLQVSGSGSAANVDSRTETVVAPSTTTAPRPTTTQQSSVRPAPSSSSGPIEIQVIEADPLVEGEAFEMDTDAMFEGAVEIPVIRLED